MLCSDMQISQLWNGGWEVGGEPRFVMLPNFCSVNIHTTAKLDMTLSNSLFERNVHNSVSLCKPTQFSEDGLSAVCSIAPGHCVCTSAERSFIQVYVANLFYAMVPVFCVLIGALSCSVKALLMTFFFN